ncbi:MAG: hypothetical protein ACTSUE_16780 [Promethearchaeota archaeon]
MVFQHYHPHAVDMEIVMVDTEVKMAEVMETVDTEVKMAEVMETVDTEVKMAEVMEIMTMMEDVENANLVMKKITISATPARRNHASRAQDTEIVLDMTNVIVTEDGEDCDANTRHQTLHALIIPNTDMAHAQATANVSTRMNVIVIQDIMEKIAVIVDGNAMGRIIKIQKYARVMGIV